MALIELSVVGNPPKVELKRTAGVPDDLWYGLPLRLLPVTAARPRGDVFMVPVERFLAERKWIAAQCRAHNTDVVTDEPVRELLARAVEEQATVTAIVESGSALEGPSPEEALDGSRYVRDLRDFQIRDLTKLLGLPHGANFSVPGAGKTAVTLALYEAERLRDRVARLLVVAPLSAFDAWESETARSLDTPPPIVRFSGFIPHDAEIVVVNYQKLAGHYETLSAWLQGAPTHLVLDEAHRMKSGRNGEWGTACLDLAYLAARRDVLSGTPAPQSPADFIALVDFLWPSQARRVLPAQALARNPSDDAMDLVNQRLGPLFVRTTKRELGLEQPVQWVERVALEGLQRQIYEAMRNQYAGLFDLSRADQTMFAQMGEVTIYLLQAATNPALLARRIANQGASDFRWPSLEIQPGSELADLIAAYPVHEIPLKFQKLAILVRANAEAGRKTLVWSYFPGNLLALENLLARYQPALIYGGIPTDDGTLPPGTRTREAELARFRTDPDCLVLLANPAATSEGVSLHEVCHEAIYVERTFNAGQYLQSVDRIHRLGLEPGIETRITFLLTEGTIDERVDARVAEKAARLARMLNDPDLVTMALPDEDDYGEAIDDVGDITALFEHLSGR